MSFNVRSAKKKIPVLTGIYAGGTLLGGCLPIIAPYVGGAANVFVGDVLLLMAAAYMLYRGNREIPPVVKNKDEPQTLPSSTNCGTNGSLGEARLRAHDRFLPCRARGR